MTTFEPTHKCFDDALDCLSAAMRECHHYRDRWRLVHAICKCDGGLFAHAWCEVNESIAITAFMIGGIHTYVQMKRRDFYKLYQPQMMTKYNPFEAVRENERTLNFGPWLDCYRDHCGGNEILGAVTVELKK